MLSPPFILLLFATVIIITDYVKGVKPYYIADVTLIIKYLMLDMDTRSI